ncbi:cytochrome c biogenesis CcdA family protein [Aestuariimicrobium soli]|uniref:cytochrome c biogenesis CcdA family protein n=1 Tax=Aestuariimicrobium soli TaxID=2035834 RepID=UPI003EB8475B
MQGWINDSIQGGLLLAIPVALLAGLVSFFSPCVLPLLPGYLSYATGLGVSEISAGRAPRRRMLLGTLLFVLGFAVVFTLTGATIGGLGGLLMVHQRLISIVTGVVIIALGLVFGGWLPLGRGTLRLNRAPTVGVVAAPLLGLVFAIGWTPCIGPALSVVLTLAFTEGSAPRGALLAFVYALGLGIPFLAAALAFGSMGRLVGFVKRHQRLFQTVGAALMVLVGLALVTGVWDRAMAELRQWVVSFGTPI